MAVQFVCGLAWLLRRSNPPDLSISDVLAALAEVTRPLQVDLAEFHTIENNHPGDIGRQKTEVVKYWLHNSPDASWTTLANAVERMHGRTY